MAPTPQPANPMTRDARADVFRGLALWMIVVNHTPGNILGQGYLAGFGMTIGTVFGRLAGEGAASLARN